jgi:hypothetical protein
LDLRLSTGAIFFGWPTLFQVIKSITFVQVTFFALLQLERNDRFG